MTKRYLILLLVLLMLTSTVQGNTTVLNAFNKGELSPYLEGRTDVKAYYSGCRTLENMVVLPYGGVSKRPGSYYVASAKSGSAACRLIPFEFSVTQAYVIELGNLYMRFYRNGGQIVSGEAPYEIVTPYLTADLFEIQFIQSADIIYFVHPDYAPRSLTRTGHASWTLTEIDFERGPFLEENETDVTVAPSGTTGSITLSASDGIFNANHVGALWQITQVSEATDTSGSFTAVGNSTELNCQQGRDFDFTTHGTWDGTVLLQRSYDDGTVWKDVYSFHSEDDGNISYSDSEIVDDAIYRVRMSVRSSGTCNYYLLMRSFDVKGVARISAFTDSRNVTATVKYEFLDTTAVTDWAEGAWSPDEGYPGSIAFYEERQVYAGTTSQSQTLWFSQTDDWDNFLAGADDTDAITLTLASDHVNSIRWLVPQTALLIGTSGSEWTISASASNEPLTPTNVVAKRHSSSGSANIQALSMDNIIIFVQRQDQILRKLQYSWEQDNWISPNLTILSEHITGDGVTGMALQRNPYPVLWAVREDGALLGLTLEESQEVIGWHRHEFGGDVESVVVIPGSSSTFYEDEVWISISRSVGGSTVRYVEQLRPFDWGDDQEDSFFVDSGLTYDGGDAVDITDITEASPGVVTAAGHAFSDGDQVRIKDTVGMTQVNNVVFSVNDVDVPAGTFSLMDATYSVDWDTSDTDIGYTDDEAAYYTTVQSYGSSYFSAQTFKTDAAITIDTIQIVLQRGGTSIGVPADPRPGTCILEIYPVGGTSRPDMSDTALASGSKSANNFVAINVSPTSTFEEFEITSTSTLEADTTYAIVVRVPAGDVDNKVFTLTPGNDSSYADGSAMQSITAGVTWVNIYYDVPFRIWGTEVASGAYVSGGVVKKVENTFGGLNHLENEVVVAQGDGGVAYGYSEEAGQPGEPGHTETITVTSNTVTLSDYYNTVHIGKGFTAKLLPMKLEMSTTPGALFGITKRITEITARFYETLECKIGTSWDDYDSYLFRDADDPLEAISPLYSDDKTILFDGDYEKAGNIYIQSTLPMPMTILSLMVEFEEAE